MISSDLPSPAEASSGMNGWLEGFAQAGNRYPLFGIMLYDACRPPALICGKIPSRIFA